MAVTIDNKINVPTNVLATYNPSLTGNIKIIVDSNNDIFLQSIDVNDTLSRRIFKRVGIQENLGYANALLNFMKISSELSNEKMFDNSRILRQPNSEIYFTEKHTLFAPISINKIEELPDYFVIFKVSNKFTDYTDVIKQGNIVKSFDLKNSRLGELFRNTTIPRKIIEKDYFNPDRYFLCGIDYRYGTNNQYQIFYNDTGKSNTAIFNDLVPKFSELFLISAHYYNLCFLFDDVAQDDEYYVGYYFYNTAEETVKINFDSFNYKNIMNNNYHNVLPDILLSDIIPLQGNVDLQTTDSEICVIKNKQENLFNIKKYITTEKDTQILTPYTIDLSDFYGTLSSSGISINGTILKGKDFANLSLTLNTTESNTLCNGDYIAIKPGILNYEWRVIMSDTNCCFDDEFCYYNTKRIRCLANISNIEEYDGVNAVELTINDLIELSEGEYITFSTNTVSNIKTEIVELRYDIDNKSTIFKILDYGKIFMDYAFPLLKIDFVYTQPSYYYVFVNPNGDSSYVAHKIVNGFEKFTNRTFDVVHQNNKIIFTANDKGESFADYKFAYNFSKSNTQINLFKVNNIVLNGKSYKNKSGNTFITRKRNVIKFTGGANYGTPMRFFIDKNYEFSIGLSDVVFETKKGYYPLKSYDIDGTVTYKSNYLEEKKTDSTFRNI